MLAAQLAAESVLQSWQQLQEGGLDGAQEHCCRRPTGHPLAAPPLPCLASDRYPIQGVVSAPSYLPTELLAMYDGENMEARVGPLFRCEQRCVSFYAC